MSLLISVLVNQKHIAPPDREKPGWSADQTPAFLTRHRKQYTCSSLGPDAASECAAHAWTPRDSTLNSGLLTSGKVLRFSKSQSVQLSGRSPCLRH